MKLYLAPLQSYTEVEFRNAWADFFDGIDVAVSPFIPLAEGFRFRSKHLRDVLPEHNGPIPVIPQVLGTEPGKFIFLASALKELGYETVNWNLGCPKKSVARKKRGAGLLPYPELLRKILDELTPKLPVRLSVKMRLGYLSPEEFIPLTEVLNDYPLDCLIIHPRTGIQMYEGELHLQALEQTAGLVRHKIVFSGDISDFSGFRVLQKRFPQINDWMIGRGLLTNPFLPHRIKTGKPETDDEKSKKILYAFHKRLQRELEKKFVHEKTVLNKLKGFWAYFSRWFEDEQTLFEKISRTGDLKNFTVSLERIFNEHPLSKQEGRSNKPVK